MGMSYRQSRRITHLCLIIALCIAAIPFLYPFLWMISASLKSNTEVFGSLSLIPTKWRWENYAEVFSHQPFARQYLNSLYIAITVSVVTIFLSSLAGYALARIRFAGATLLMLFLISAMMVPEEITIIPNFFLIGSLGLNDTHAPLMILPVFGSQGVFATFMMRQFFVSLPKELEEAGTLDGLSRWGVWWKIALPLARPAIAAVGIITFLFSWNLFLEPLVFISSIEKYTLPLALNNYQDVYGTPLWNLQIAATAMSIVPVLIVYVLAQRHIVESFALSGIKG